MRLCLSFISTLKYYEFMGRNRKLGKLYPTAKNILKIAGVGAFIGATLVMPGLPRLLKGLDIDLENFLEEDEWEPFDERRLRRRLKEMHEARLVKIYQEGDKFVVRLTKKGRKKYLKYQLEELNIPKQEKWDGRWRIVAYDIPRDRSRGRDAMRETLKKLGFYQLQESVYLYPYPCEDVIDFIKEFYGVGDNVTLLTISGLEESDAYRDYFDI